MAANCSYLKTSLRIITYLSVNILKESNIVDLLVLNDSLTALISRSLTAWQKWAFAATEAGAT